MFSPRPRYRTIPRRSSRRPPSPPPPPAVPPPAPPPPPPAGGTASAILRTVDGVGVGSIEYRAATPRFFAVQKEFGVRAGMGTGGLVVGEVYARPLRIGPVNIEIRGYGKRDDRSGADFGGIVLIDYRF